jgi:hypothetical protein
MRHVDRQHQIAHGAANEISPDLPSYKCALEPEELTRLPRADPLGQPPPEPSRSAVDLLALFGSPCLLSLLCEVLWDDEAVVAVDLEVRGRDKLGLRGRER